jgi:glycosyltransferase involved in cell wall biosynthesis
LKKARLHNAVAARVQRYYAKVQPYVEPWIRRREIERYTFELASASFQLHQYDLIHTQDIVSTRAIARVKPRHVPLVATLHGLLAEEQRVNGAIRSTHTLRWKYACLEEYLGATSADRTIVPTEWLKHKLGHRDIGVPPHALHIVPYGMEIEPFLQRLKDAPSSPVPPVKKGKTVLMCHARLSPVKGHRYLLQAIHQLKRKRRDFVCWLVGGGSLSHELAALSQSLNITDMVRFLGTRSDVPQLLKRSDIIVLPSVQDNHPFSVMEAQVAGITVLASRVGGIPEMVRDGETGFLFSPGNSDDLADKLDDVLSHPTIRRKVADRAQQWGMEQWSSAILLNRTLEMYAAVLGK